MANVVINQDIEFWEEKSAWQGVKRVAGYVRNDMEKVFGKKPAICEDGSPKSQTVVLYGTIGKSKRLDMLESAGKLDLSGVRGKREVYLFQVVENPMEGVKSALVIAGKRQTRHDLRVVSFIGKIGRIATCQLESCAAKTQRICDFDRERFFCFKGTVGEIPWIFY